MKRNILVAVIVFVLAGAALYQDISAKDHHTTAVPVQTAPKVGYLAPSFSLTALDGQTYVVGGPRDKPLYLNFWASWCGPCEEEAPDLQRMYSKYKDKLDMYGVNVSQNDYMPNVKAMVEQYHFTFPILLDKEGKAVGLYSFQVVPTSFLIDKNGAIVDIVHTLGSRELEKKIKDLIERDG